MEDYNEARMNNKNILIVTSMYPLLDTAYEGTKVCHYFATEWLKEGYNVRVIRLSTYFPKIAYSLAKLFKEKIKAKTGAVVYTKQLSKYDKYEIDGVKVLLTPVFKFIPHMVPNENTLSKILKKPIKDLGDEGFVPDVITAHFQNPQLKALYILKQNYPTSRICMVMHNNGKNLPRLYKKDLHRYMNNIDVWGFRSYAFRDEFEKMYGKQKQTFICTSGIPESFLSEKSKTFGSSIRRFVFCGSLFELKRVKDTIIALATIYPDKDFEFDIIGDGAEMANLKQIAYQYGVEGNVHFHGFKPRSEAQKIISQADVFVMVSAHEAFGLVYVEAMGKGCITIGTKGQGIDGVIKHGINGFLCEACNPHALAQLIEDIKNMPKEKVQEISYQALQTARKMTNSEVAINYLESIKCSE